MPKKHDAVYDAHAIKAKRIQKNSYHGYIQVSSQEKLNVTHYDNRVSITVRFNGKRKNLDKIL